MYPIPRIMWICTFFNGLFVKACRNVMKNVKGRVCNFPLEIKDLEQSQWNVLAVIVHQLCHAVVAQVEYQCDGFLEKNKDTVNEEQINVLKASKVTVINTHTHTHTPLHCTTASQRAEYVQSTMKHPLRSKERSLQLIESCNTCSIVHWPEILPVVSGKQRPLLAMWR